MHQWKCGSSNGNEQTRSKKKDSEAVPRHASEHTVFKDKLAGAVMGAKLMELENGRAFMVGLYNQVGIQMMRKEAMISRQYLINALHR